MALVPVFGHGFDDTDLANLPKIVDSDGPGAFGNLAVPSSGGRNNGRYVQSLNSNSRIVINVPATTDTYAFGCAVKPVSFIGNNELLGFCDNLVGQVSLKLRADRRLELRLNDDNGTQLGLPGTASIPGDAWTHLAIWLVIAAGTGRVVVKVNSIVDIDTGPGGVTTKFTANNYLTQMRTGSNNGNNIRDVGFDDIWAATAAGTSPGAGYGDITFIPLFPTADDTVQWSHSSGAVNWDMVNDPVPDGDSTYNFTSTVGQQDKFVSNDLTQSIGSIPFVVVNTIDRKEDSGGVILRHIIDVGGVVSEGPDFGPSTSYDHHQSFFTTQPGGAAWTIAAANNSKPGYKYQAFV